MWKIHKLLLAIALLAAGTFASAEPVDINTATAEQLSAAMKSVGKAKAEAIVKDREKNGPFKSVDDLARVKGIKAATINKNRDKLTVGGAPVPAAPAPVKGVGVPATPAAPPAAPPVAPPPPPR